MGKSIKPTNDNYWDTEGIYDSDNGLTLNLLAPNKDYYHRKFITTEWDSYILNFFNSQNASYNPTLSSITAGGPVVSLIWMKHSDSVGGVVIAFNYTSRRPIYYLIKNRQIETEYYL